MIQINKFTEVCQFEGMLMYRVSDLVLISWLPLQKNQIWAYLEQQGILSGQFL